MTQKIKLQPETLTADAFAPFGSVVEAGIQTPMMINGGNTERFHALARVQLGREDDEAIISIFRGQPRQLPMRIEMLERHPLGSQHFQPLGDSPYLVLVAAGDSQPRPDELRLFLAEPHQGVQYHRNTWHHPLLALDQPCDFLVVDRDGEGENCEEIWFPDEYEITLSLD